MGEKFRLGVTGGIGSGKTSVCRVFNLLGVPVFSADEAARDIMDNDRTVIDKVNLIAGKDLYVSGKLDRSALAGLVFTDPRLLKEINQTVHPAVRERFKEWEELQTAAYVIFEAAILFESGTFQVLDRILTVVAPVEERIERVIKRNNLSREQILDRIRNQSDDNYKISRSHYVIDNSENKMIIPEILKIHNDILNIIKKGGDGKVR